MFKLDLISIAALLASTTVVCATNGEAFTHSLSELSHSSDTWRLTSSGPRRLVSEGGSPSFRPFDLNVPLTETSKSHTVAGFDLNHPPEASTSHTVAPFGLNHVPVEAATSPTHTATPFDHNHSPTVEAQAAATSRRKRLKSSDIPEEVRNNSDVRALLKRRASKRTYTQRAAAKKQGQDVPPVPPKPLAMNPKAVAKRELRKSWTPEKKLEESRKGTARRNRTLVGAGAAVEENKAKRVRVGSAGASNSQGDAPGP